MAPARKKSKLASNENETEAARQQSQQDGDDQSGKNTTINVRQQQQPGDIPADTNVSPTTATQPSNNRGSWYSATSWRSKAGPVAQVAKESISVDKGVSSIASDQKTAPRRPSQSISKSFKGGSRKSIPLAAEPTKVHANPSDVSLPPKQAKKAPHPASEKTSDIDKGLNATEERKEEQLNGAPQLSEPEAGTVMGNDEDKAETASTRPQSGAWFGWWSRPDGYAGNDAERIKSSATADLSGTDDGSGTSAANTRTDNAPVSQEVIQKDDDTTDQLQPEMSMNNTGSRSWFKLWSSTQNEQAEAEDRERRQSNTQTEQEQEQDVTITADPPQATEQNKSTEQASEDDVPKSSGWAFWSRDKPKEEALQADGTQKEVGELAVADTPSQSHPEAAQFNQETEVQKTAQHDVKRSSSLLRLKRGRSEKSKDLSSEVNATATPAGLEVPTPAISQLQTPIETPEASPDPAQRGKKPVQSRPNLVLPAFRDAYPVAPNPGVVQRIAEYIAHTLHIPGYDPSRPLHPYVSTNPPKVRRAIAIGVHGFFPAPLLQRVLGQPTGTSIRFSNYAAASIKQWCQDHQPDVKDVEVEKVALEGEGYIADRVATLWKLLLNWLSHLRKADFILVACHSQGVPVAIMLVAKLIQLGCLSPNVRLGICAMAGINLGPFPEYKNRLFGGTALELFDFCESNSKVSIAYRESLDICLRQGVRINFVGSIDDQLVSLESSLHMPLIHPYVSRTVFIDGRLHVSNFLNHLVVFAVKLRNLGVSDHGLIREISAPLAGSLVGGEGHSRVYDDPEVYRTSIEFALETTDVNPAAFSPSPPSSSEERRKSMEAATQRRASLAAYPSNMTAANSMRRGSLSSLSLNSHGIAPIFAPWEASGSAAPAAEKNPYVLPWAVRGMLEEGLVKVDIGMQEEVKELVKEFEAWRPTSKVLRDVRWRLEGVRSML